MRHENHYMELQYGLPKESSAIIVEYRPDIIVVPECENPDALKIPQRRQTTGLASHGLAITQNKGLGVFSLQ